MKPARLFLLLLLWLLLAASCAPPAPPAPAAVSSATAPAPSAVFMLPPTATAPPPAATRALTASPTATPSPQVCSPLEGYALSDLPGMISNPYNPPPPGSDDPHQAIDLAVRLPGSQVALAGHPVTAAYPGRVVTVMRDRFPYGSAVLVETSLDEYPGWWWQAAAVPTPAPTLIPRSALTCPAGFDAVFDAPGSRSLYTLYAHLQQIAPVQPGDTVACGQPLGTVGDSGNALNPHLHFEVRAGPAGLRLASMAHYDASASPQEMSSYCLWRISGLFQLVDPLLALQISE